MSKAFKKALALDLPVLFVNIGWAQHYGGTEEIKGAHGFLKLKKNRRDNGEVTAFVRDADGFFHCGIGSGTVVCTRFHIVFVARENRNKSLQVVGLYATARAEPEPDGKWCWATTRNAVPMPDDRRPEIAVWPGARGMRRWASRGHEAGVAHPQLLKSFEDLKKQLAKLAQVAARSFSDQTYWDAGAIEGLQRKQLIMHRTREAKLRQAKIRAALQGTGRLACEVPGCGFDFHQRYGKLGYGYVHVHHRRPLSEVKKGGQKMTVADLALVCANCHAMIHKDGGCRELHEIIPYRLRR